MEYIIKTYIDSEKVDVMLPLDDGDVLKSTANSLIEVFECIAEIEDIRHTILHENKQKRYN